MFKLVNYVLQSFTEWSTFPQFYFQLLCDGLKVFLGIYNSNLLHINIVNLSCCSFLCYFKMSIHPPIFYHFIGGRRLLEPILADCGRFEVCAHQIKDFGF